MALVRDDLKTVRQRKYFARDFDSLRALMLEYARLYYPDNIRDLSESSMGGLFMDFAAMVGDNMSFYLDHQFAELSSQDAVEDVNIERHLKAASVPIVGAAPALAPVTIYIQIPAVSVDNTIIPMEDALPIAQSNSVFVANNGVQFVLIEDVDFGKTGTDGNLLADIKIGSKTVDGEPITYILSRVGLCVSGQEVSEVIPVGEQFIPFRKLSLNNPNVSEIISVGDGYGNTYYEVGNLTHDTVYRNVLNTAKDNEIVKDTLKLISAPYRFMVDVDISSRRSTLTFGGGSANTINDDIIPDPSDFAISFPYSRTFSRVAVNPNQLLQTKTLGTATTSTAVTITYRHGGGLSHNVAAGSIENIQTLKMTFPGNPSPSVAGAVRSTIEITNLINAGGGEDAPGVDDLKNQIPAVKNSQERIVSKKDLLARIYTMPSNFGRVFRAAVRSNDNNPLATQLYVVSRDANSRLIISPDSLKTNLIKYLDPYRMISDAIDILDSRIVDFSLTFDVLIDPTLNKSIVLQNVLKKMQKYFDIKNFNIDQPIVIDEVRTLISNVLGIISINELLFENISGTHNNKKYSDVIYDLHANTEQKIIFPPPGGIFECRYKDIDLIGKASV